MNANSFSDQLGILYFASSIGFVLIENAIKKKFNHDGNVPDRKDVLISPPIPKKSQETIYFGTHPMRPSEHRGENPMNPPLVRIYLPENKLF
jgi:hypothetical protein